MTVTGNWCFVLGMDITYGPHCVVPLTVKGNSNRLTIMSECGGSVTGSTGLPARLTSVTGCSVRLMTITLRGSLSFKITALPAASCNRQELT